MAPQRRTMFACRLKKALPQTFRLHEESFYIVISRDWRRVRLFDMFLPLSDFQAWVDCVSLAEVSLSFLR